MAAETAREEGLNFANFVWDVILINPLIELFKNASNPQLKKTIVWLQMYAIGTSSGFGIK